MKKGLIMGIIGVGSFLLMMGVKAETLDLTNVSSTGQVVTVGDVDAPVYSVDITWGDLTFDYKYDNNTGEYYWSRAITCHELTDSFSASYNFLDVFWDGECEREIDVTKVDFATALTNNAYYAESGMNGTISITDNSTNARIVPSIAWQSESKYDFVKANFQYEGPVCNDAGECGAGWKDLTTSTLPNEARQENAGSGITTGHYFLSFDLENNPAKESVMPTAGDKIGTITISIDAE